MADPTATTITITLGLRRWFKWWAAAVVVLNHFTGWRPSDATIERWARRGVYVKHES